MNKRKICIITSTRADYGLLAPLLAQIQSDSSLTLQLIATGMHLSPEFGMTVNEIENDGYQVSCKVETLLSSDSAVGIGKSMGLGLIGFSEAFACLKPDVVLILGDRYEILAAASAALVAKLPIAHISGGEITEGAYDNSIRHALTKFSHLHFTSTEIYRNRVIQLGEAPKTVFNVGSPAIDNIKQTDFLSKKEFEKLIGQPLRSRNLLVTFHPATLGNQKPGDQFQELLNALDSFKDLFLLFTYPNADNEGRTIIEMIQNYVSLNRNRAFCTPSLGRINYLSALTLVDGVIGNSSSGIVEVPSFKIGTINIGERQRGRLRSSSIIDCQPTECSIAEAIKTLYSPAFQQQLQNTKSLFGQGDSCRQIKDILKQYDLRNCLQKQFHDIT